MGIRSILFYRDFDHFSGGHLKVFDYYQSVLAHPGFTAAIGFSARSTWDSSNPWLSFKDQVVEYNPDQYDLVFLGGMDWIPFAKAQPNESRPVINLIQHVRHADPSQDVYPFLARKAIRICVSAEVSEAILDTGKVNGPVFTINNGVHIPRVSEHRSTPTTVFIDALKNPKMGEALHAELSGKNVEVAVSYKRMCREDYLARLESCRIAVLLPNTTEGFYLPALESLQLSGVTIVPDCVGNRGFCHDLRSDPDEGNCFLVSYNLDDILVACYDAIKMLDNSDELSRLRRNACDTVSEHSLESERNQFYQILENVEGLWKQMG